MRILVLSINYAPELTGIGKYTGEMAEWLAGRGHQVRVVTAPPYYPHWRVDPPYSPYRYRKESIQGVTVWRCPVWVPARPTGIKRLLHLAGFALASLPVMLAQVMWRPQVVLAIEPPLFAAPVAGLTSLLSRARSWLHVQDFEVDAAFDLGLIRNRQARRVVNAVESWLLRRFHTVSTISWPMLERLGAKGVTPARRFLFPNWVDLKAIHPLAEPSPLRKTLHLDERTVVALYAGNMGEKQGLEIVIEAAHRLAERKDLLFVMCGDGAAHARLRRQAEGLTNLRWLPLQPAERLNDLLNLADVHLLPQRGDVADLVLPSKLTGMLASGRPVLATAHPGTQIQKTLESKGVVVLPGDVINFSISLSELADNAAARSEMGRLARQYAKQHLDREAILRRFEQALEGTVGPQN